jgi:hypothetical protein
MIIKKTRSLCPVCNAVLEASIEEENGGIWMERTCPEHGQFRDLYWADAELWKRFERYEAIGKGLENPQKEAPPDGCPAFCGICSNHRSTTLLANMDLTNRCNLRCDFCFANAQACGFIYEPTFDQVVAMLRVLRDEKPIPCPAVQFSGGEPTMREDLPRIVQTAKELGFPQVQIATNGIKLANDPDYLKELREAGLSTIYLHFDGVTRETNFKLKSDEKVIRNCEQAKVGLVLVPTIIRGRNDHEAGAIIEFAARHIGVVRGVNFQPIAFTGAASEEDVQRERITIPELLDRIEAQTNRVIRKSDFYPVPCVIPFSDLVEAYTGKPQIRFTAHQHCGAATYVFVTEKGLVPVNRMVDVDAFFESVEEMAEKMKNEGKISRYLALLSGVNRLRLAAKASEQGDSSFFWNLVLKTLRRQNFDALRDFHWNALFIGTMHFMDRYNYDLARVQRCCIHYTTPDGTLIPFCTYNSGPVYREQVWKKWSSPLDN